MAGIKEIAGAKPRDEIKQALYDSHDISSGSTITDERRFFVSNQGKDLTQTNMKASQQLEAMKSFKVLGIRMDASNADVTKLDLLRLFEIYSSLDFWIQEKSYFQAPLRHITGKLDSKISLAGSTDLAKAHQSYGDKVNNPVVFKGIHCHEIGPQQSFYAIWKVSGASAGQIIAMTPSGDYPVRFTLKLEGIMRRAVQ